MESFGGLLDELTSQGILYKGKANRYALPASINLLVGTLNLIKSGAGFVVPDARDGDLYIPTEGMNTAVDGDRVIARVESRQKGGKSQGPGLRRVKRARASLGRGRHPAKVFGTVCAAA